MISTWTLLEQYLHALGQFLINPLLYVFVLFIFLHYRKQMMIERQLFAVRIQSPLLQTARSIGLGLLGGMFVTVTAGLSGMIVQVTDFSMIWFLAIGLAFIRIRYLCLAYATSILTFLHGLAVLIPQVTYLPGIGTVWEWLLVSQPIPLLGLVALLHIVEAYFVRFNGSQDASPLFIEGKRGRIVGAYQLQAFWLTPLILLVPSASSGLVVGSLYDGWPLFSPDFGSGALGMLLLPAVTGFSAMTQAMTPRMKAEEMSKQLLIYAVVLLALVYAATWLPALMFLAALFALFGHEGLALLSKWQEEHTPPYFVPSARGVKVMAVIPNTPAEEMGIQAGEVISKVNGVSVRDKSQLYPTLQANPAFCKMEVLTLGGEIKFTQCAIYAGNHHQLGIIVVPDETTQQFVDVRKASLVELLKQRMEKVKFGA